MAELNKYKTAIQKVVGTDQQIFLFWKGRVALYAILKALGIGKGDEVIIPGFTCVVVPNAVIYTGATPIYVDVDESTYTSKAEAIERLITPKTKAIIAQNTFGLSADLDPIMALAEQHGIEVIDDCTHGFGGTYNGAPNGTKTKAAFFSTQWNKPYSTGIGGFAITKDADLATKLSSLEGQATKPSGKEVFMLKLMSWVRSNLLNGGTYWTIVHLYRWLSSKNLVVGSSQGEELESPEMPDDFLKTHSDIQAKFGNAELHHFQENLVHRKTVASAYDERLKSLGKMIPFQPEYAEHIFLKYPIRLKNREEFMAKAEAAKVRLGDWFNSPLHPIQGDLSAWKYEVGNCPVAEKLAAEVVNLPTDPDLSIDELERVKKFLTDNANYLL